MQTRNGKGPYAFTHPRRIHRFARVKYEHGGEGGSEKCGPFDDPARLLGGRIETPPHPLHRVGARWHRHHQSITVLGRQPHGPGPKSGYVQRYPRCESHESRVRHEVAHRLGPSSPRHLRFATVEQRPQFPQMGIELGNRHGPMAHHAHGGVAGADAAEHSSGGDPIDGGMGRGRHRRLAGTSHRHPGAELDSGGAGGNECHGGVAIRPDHLAVSHPDVAVSQRFRQHCIVNVVDLGRHTHPDVHHAMLSHRATQRVDSLGWCPPPGHCR